MATPARMRTAAKVLEEIQKDDPDTEVTLHYIRALIHTRQVPITPVGRKKLVNLDTILDYIAQGDSAPEPGDTETGTIRQVSV